MVVTPSSNKRVERWRIGAGLSRQVDDCTVSAEDEPNAEFSHGILFHRPEVVMSSRVRLLLPLAYLVCATASAFAQAPKVPEGVTTLGTVEGITEYRLANGLRILLLADQSQPKVTVNNTIFVGSRHEGYGETGMAHLLEHMVFKGCTKFKDVPKALRDHGADFNGTTWLDRTNYYETMPANDDNLEFGIELEADRMTNSFIKREDLLSEFTVVRNEFEAGENSPQSILSQRMTATAFEWHNYGKSTIGNRTDIERVPIDNLQAFYKKYYRPDNAMVIVAGKFDATKALELIVKHFGPLKNPKEPLPLTYTEEPPQDGERLVTLRRVGAVGATGVIYHIPAGAHPDYPACEVLEQCLTSQPSGRVYKALVESKKATNLNGATYPLHDPGTIEIIAQTEPEKTEAARETLIEVLENLAKTPLTDEEVDRAKRQLLQYRERMLANSQQFAVGLSDWAACGDWRLSFLHRDRLEKVTAADVNKAAAKYLTRANRTVGVYIPTKQAERAEIPETPNALALVKDYKGRTALSSGEAFDPTPDNVEARVQRGTVGEGVKTAFLSKKTRGETVNINMVLRFGNEESLKGKSTAADLLGTMMMRGTKTKTRQQIKDELEKLNATLAIGSQMGKLTITGQTKKANLPAVLKLLGEILREPAFPEKEFELLKGEQLAQFTEGKTDPQMLAVFAMRKKIASFPADDVRYVPSLDETIDRLKAASVKDLVDLYESQLGSGAGELAIVGEFDAGEVKGLVDGFLKGWVSKAPYKRIVMNPKTVAGSTEKIITPDKANAIYVAAMMMPLTDSDPDYAALEVGNYLLGAAPLASRLSNRVRGKDGLSYGIMSMVQENPLDPATVFLVFAITNPQNMPKVDAAIAEEVTKFIKEGVSAAELEEAKKAYLQSLKQERASDATLAGKLVTGLNVGRTMNFNKDLEAKIESLQPGDVKKAFDKYLKQGNLTIIQAGDLNKKEEPKKDEKK